MRTRFTVLGILLLSVAAIHAQQVVIHQTPIPKTSWASGEEMYVKLCSTCHGINGDGHGPAAPAFKLPVADLTTLAKRNGGKFPYDDFDLIMRFGKETVDHGFHSSAKCPECMPVWEPLFATLPNETEASIHQRIGNLARYVASLQPK